MDAIAKRSTTSSPGSNQALNHAKYAMEAAEQILKCYPDYGKAPDSYIVALSEALASYPRETIARLAHRVHGIPGKCKFLPTVADVIEQGDAIGKSFMTASMQTDSGYKRLTSRDADPRPAQTAQERRAFVEGVIKKAGMEKQEEKRHWQPPPPRVDISDFPDSPLPPFMDAAS